MKWNLAVLMLLFGVSAQVSAEFRGELKLVPEGCANTPPRICRLDSLLTFTSKNGLIWQTDVWEDGNGQSGTTDGASIPEWAQAVIGDAYDESYLKAAIVHDHYCYKENHVRSWRETHRMFYDALVDLGIEQVKAKTMYFAVYAFGPRWVELVPGSNCGQNCINAVSASGEKKDADKFAWLGTQTEIARFQAMVEQDQDMELYAIEAYAKSLTPNDFYLNHGDSYVPAGDNDPKIHATY
ncbi:DUF1353 domain-containing protein [Stutzerimonas stutzeri]|uniref:DUF1353 domain-containing protein n=1 Tax=Stutzerimonas stutzeri TaxID=316 RepID=UPI003723E291